LLKTGGSVACDEKHLLVLENVYSWLGKGGGSRMMADSKIHGSG
jgi:hypothetical protein